VYPGARKFTENGLETKTEDWRKKSSKQSGVAMKRWGQEEELGEVGSKAEQ
jgi:hypothetical protein